MLKTCKVFFLVFFLFPLFVYSSEGAKKELQMRLFKISFFSAQFKQEIYEDGFLTEEGEGEFWLSRPNLFNWQVKEPDPISIISDGKTIWYYTPEVAQVTLFSPQQIDKLQLFHLLTDVKSQSWQDYTISQQDDRFLLIPKDPTLNRYELVISKKGELQQMIIAEAEDQKTIYSLTRQNHQKTPSSKFKFVVPKNVTIDDQREGE